MNRNENIMQLNTAKVPAPDKPAGRFQSLGDGAPIDLNVEKNTAVLIIAENLHRLNRSIAEAVSAGLTVDILRSSRCHNEAGNWGDQVMLNVSK
jgi:hypothetical protein